MREDTHALNKLLAVSQTKTRIIIAAAGYFLPGGEREDLAQEAMIGVMDALRRYDPARGSFANLAELAIKRRIWSGITQANRQKHRVLSGAYPLHGHDHRAHSDNEGPSLEEILPARQPETEEIIASRETLRAIRWRFAQLSQLERQALTLQLNDYSYQDAAAELQVSTKTIDNALQRGRHKLTVLTA